MRPLALLVALIVASCGRPAVIPAHDVHVSWLDAPKEVVFGAPFSATFVTTSALDADVADVDLASLGPLFVDGVQRDVETSTAHRRETWTLRGRVLDLGEVAVPGPVVTATWPDGRTREARTDGLMMNVVSGLDDSDTGDIELPNDVLDLPTRSFEIAAFVVALALLAVWFASRRRSARDNVEPGTPPDLRGQLERLRQREPTTPHEWEALGVELAATVRDLVEASPHDTSQEVAAQRAGREERVLLDVLGTCDGVKFGLGQPSRARRDAAIDAALELLVGGST